MFICVHIYTFVCVYKCVRVCACVSHGQIQINLSNASQEVLSPSSLLTATKV